MDWSILYPDTITSSENDKSNQVKRVEFADIGCGYGGLLGKKDTLWSYLVQKINNSHRATYHP